MSRDTFDGIAGKLRLRAPAVDILLARDIVKNAFRTIKERRLWSWQLKQGIIIVPAAVTTGTANVTNGSTEVVLSVATSADAIGRQFKASTFINTIIDVSSDGLTLTLDNEYGGTTNSTSAYTIYRAYYTVPTDFRTFLSVVDPTDGHLLGLNTSLTEINQIDPQRTNIGNPVAVVPFDYSPIRSGTFSTATALRPAGSPLTFGTSTPIFGGTYTGRTDASIVVKFANAAANIVQVSVVKSSGTAATYTIVTGDESDIQIGSGLTISLPDIATSGAYSTNDVYIITATAMQSGGLPRYELWPHRIVAGSYSFTYVSEYPDLDDAVLPYSIPGNALLELALADTARYPGPSPDKANPYFQIGLAEYHMNKFERIMIDLERLDDEIFEQNIFKSSDGRAVFPDSNYLQSHTL